MRPSLLIVMCCGACTGELLIGGTRGNAAGADPTHQVDVIVPATGPEVDVVFVVDNSRSMNEHQPALDENAGWFVQYFLDSSVDYHLGVVTTDVVSADHSGRLQPAFGQPWLQPGIDNPVDTFVSMANVGTDGELPEQGLRALILAKEVEVEANAGFFRDRASVHAVVVSNERDFTYGRDPEGLQAFVDWFDGLRRSTAERSFSAVDDEDFGPSGPGGHRYADVAAAIGGSVQPIEAINWSVALFALGLNAVNVGDAFYLSRPAVPSSIDVTLRVPTEAGEPIVERVRRRDWDYDDERNAVVLVQPPANDRTEVWIAYRIRSR